jgi:uncharacterized protein (DUF2062 family)
MSLATQSITAAVLPPALDVALIGGLVGGALVLLLIAVVVTILVVTRCRRRQEQAIRRCVCDKLLRLATIRCLVLCAAF